MVPIVQSGKTRWYQLSIMAKLDGTNCPVWQNWVVPIVQSGKTRWYQVSGLAKLDGTNCPVWQNWMVPIVQSGNNGMGSIAHGTNCQAPFSS